MKKSIYTFFIITSLFFSCSKDDNNNNNNNNNNPQPEEPTIQGSVSTFAGSTNGTTNGTGTSAQFGLLKSICADNVGNIYVVDLSTKIRKITPAGVVTDFAGTSGAGFEDGAISTAKFSNISCITMDASNNMYLADNHRIRKITSTGEVSTIGGSSAAGYLNGPDYTSQFTSPTGLAIGNDGAVYVSEVGSFRIRKIFNNTVLTVAGSTDGTADGNNTTAKFGAVYALYFDKTENVLYAADTNRLRKVTIDGTVTTITGSISLGIDNGALNEAKFFRIVSITKDNKGNLYLADIGAPATNTIRKVNIAANTVSTLAGGLLQNQGTQNGGTDGIGLNASFKDISGVVFANSALYASEYIRVRKIN
jgi:hypothetical protein